MSSSKAVSEPYKRLARTPRATPHTGNQEKPPAPPLKALKKRGCRSVCSTQRHPAIIARVGMNPRKRSKKARRSGKRKQKSTETSKIPILNNPAPDVHPRNALNHR
jgi:hypothetical protein